MFVPSQVRKRKRRHGESEGVSAAAVSWGMDSFKGHKESNEDRASFRKLRKGGWYGFGVFDGHGGHLASDFLSEHLWEYLEDEKVSLVDSFRKADSDFLEKRRDAADGSCALVALYRDRTLKVATVGDSRALLLRGSTVVRASSQHTPESEKLRIEKAGGCVVDVRGVSRVTSPAGIGFFRGGTVDKNALYLAVSRSFGDRQLKSFGIIPDPMLKTFRLEDSDSVLVLVSDGVTDVLEDDAIMDHALRERDPQLAAERITRESFRKGSEDNVTAVVVRFPWAPPTQQLQVDSLRQTSPFQSQNNNRRPRDDHNDQQQPPNSQKQQRPPSLDIFADGD